jgi:hypothetical protein
MAKPVQRKQTTRSRRGGLTRRDLALLPVVIGAMASGRAEAEASLAVEDASLADVAQALSGGKITASALARAYLARIDAYDRAGPGLNSVREINPDALSLAGRLDSVKPSARQPLAGVPILVKDNIATGDKQHTTAGSLALESARAKDDATVVKRLRAAGAVILGKANLTEFANIIAIEMPSTIGASRSCCRAARARAPPSPSRPASARRRSVPRPRARCSARRRRTAWSP